MISSRLVSVAGLKKWSLLLALLMLGGCKEPLYSHLSERAANDMMLTLLEGGVAAEKREDPETGYAVLADQSDLAQAFRLLKAAAQPEESRPTMGELFARNQLVSTPVEERVRYVYGIEESLATTLSKIDGVLVARVHIVLPENDPLALEMKPASASVFIKHRAGDEMNANVPAVKDLVVRSVEGLTVERVAVTLFPAARPSTVWKDAPPAQFMGMMISSNRLPQIASLFVLPWIVAAALGFVLLRQRYRKAAKP